nr:MauE/DoxX family redox-associated membrane protein [Pedobacter panaciterrae]
MGTTFLNQRTFHLSDKAKSIIVDIIVYLILILFMYTAASKLFNIASFSSTLAKSPLIGQYSKLVAWAIPVTEVIIGILLIPAPFRKWGLYASFGLMVLFTLYLLYMVFSGNKLPCHCGGVISTMTWQQHIWFNMGFVLLSFIGIYIHKKS